MQHIARATLALLLLSATTLCAASEAIVFGTAPTHSRAETIKLYTPLLDYLSEATGRQFVLKPAANFVEYSVRMRMGKYDMVFDGAHLTGWRMVNLGYLPLARLPGSTRIVVAARKEARVQSMAELEEGLHRVCALASPNFLTMAFLSHYPNPVRQPRLLRSRNLQELLHCIDSGRGEVAVFSEAQWEAMSDAQRGKLRLLAHPERSYPERTLSLSGKFDAALRQQLTEALLSEQGQRVSGELLARLGKKRFIPARAADYAGLDQLLNPLWGFHARN